MIVLRLSINLNLLDFGFSEYDNSSDLKFPNSFYSKLSFYSYDCIGYHLFLIYFAPHLFWSWLPSIDYKLINCFLQNYFAFQLDFFNFCKIFAFLSLNVILIFRVTLILRKYNKSEPGPVSVYSSFKMPKGGSLKPSMYYQVFHQPFYNNVWDALNRPNNDIQLTSGVLNVGSTSSSPFIIMFKMP